jgi:hypothetical protein
MWTLEVFSLVAPDPKDYPPSSNAMPEGFINEGIFSKYEIVPPVEYYANGSVSRKSRA